MSEKEILGAVDKVIESLREDCFAEREASQILLREEELIQSFEGHMRSNDHSYHSILDSVAEALLLKNLKEDQSFSWRSNRTAIDFSDLVIGAVLLAVHDSIIEKITTDARSD